MARPISDHPARREVPPLLGGVLRTGAYFAFFALFVVACRSDETTKDAEEVLSWGGGDAAPTNVARDGGCARVQACTYRTMMVIPVAIS